MMRKCGILLALLLMMTMGAGCSGNEAATPTSAPAILDPVTETATPASATPAPATQAVATPASATDMPSTPEPVEEITEDAAPIEQPEMANSMGFILADAGFETPESILYDPAGDVYLVSNINGSPTAADGNGFISQISPAGEVLTLKWIDGLIEGVTLDAPKGMAITGEELWVSDITSVRIFERTTGLPLGDVPIEGASFLNDVAAAPDGAIWVSDSSTGKLYRIDTDRNVEEMATIDGINGVAFQGETPLVTSGMSILAVAADGSTNEVAAVPTGGLDGLVVLIDGRLAVSSWNGSAVYLITDGSPVELIGDVDSPADIGYDSMRSLILIPLFRENAIQAVSIP